MPAFICATNKIVIIVCMTVGLNGQRKKKIREERRKEEKKRKEKEERRKKKRRKKKEDRRKRKKNKGDRGDPKDCEATGDSGRS